MSAYNFDMNKVSKYKTEIRNIVVKDIKYSCGKGPKNVRIDIKGNTIKIKIFGYLTSIEKFLVKNGNLNLVKEIRRRIIRIKSRHNDMIDEISKLLGCNVKLVDYNGSIQDDSLYITLIIEQ